MKDSDAKRLSTRLNISYAHALRLVRQAKQPADRNKISYPEAERWVVEGYAAPAVRPIRQVMLEAVESACMELAYQDVEYAIHGRPAGLPFGDVPLPRNAVENIAVELVEPDLDAIEWSVDEEFDGGTQVANVTVPARVTFEGFVHKSAAHHLGGDVTVSEFDWNEHMARVSFTRAVEMVFHAVIEPDFPAVENLELVGASDAGQPYANPHE